MPTGRPSVAIQFGNATNLRLNIILDRGENHNRIAIAAFVLKHHQVVLNGNYTFWFEDKDGFQQRVEPSCTLEEAVEFAYPFLPNKRRVVFRIYWPQVDLKLKTEFKEEKKVFDF